MLDLQWRRDRGRERQNERDRETQRDTERQRETMRETERHRETQRETEREEDREREEITSSRKNSSRKSFAVFFRFFLFFSMKCFL